jgi:ABC-type molybdate transport system substrate-binding protein
MVVSMPVRWNERVSDTKLADKDNRIEFMVNSIKLVYPNISNGLDAKVLKRAMEESNDKI